MYMRYAILYIAYSAWDKCDKSKSNILLSFLSTFVKIPRLTQATTEIALINI
jgi:hypothetical protein